VRRKRTALGCGPVRGWTKEQTGRIHLPLRVSVTRKSLSEKGFSGGISGRLCYNRTFKALLLNGNEWRGLDWRRQAGRLSLQGTFGQHSL